MKSLKLSLVAIVLGLCGTGANANPPGAYTEFFGEENASQTVIYATWESAPAQGAIFHAHQFGFQVGRGGYIGLQLVGNQKKVLFSIWDMTENSGSAVPLGNCDRFGGEGTGARCLINFNWIAGREYSLKVKRALSSAAGEEWKAVITDMVTGLATPIGRILLRSTGKYIGYGSLIGYSLVFTEYFGGGGCTQQPYTRLTWRGPYFGGIQARSAWISVYPSCEFSNVTSTGAPRTTHEAGGTTLRTTPPKVNPWTQGRPLQPPASPTPPAAPLPSPPTPALPPPAVTPPPAASRPGMTCSNWLGFLVCTPLRR